MLSVTVNPPAGDEPSGIGVPDQPSPECPPDAVQGRPEVVVPRCTISPIRIGVVTSVPIEALGGKIGTVTCELAMRDPLPHVIVNVTVPGVVSATGTVVTVVKVPVQPSPAFPPEAVQGRTFEPHERSKGVPYPGSPFEVTNWADGV